MTTIKHSRWAVGMTAAVLMVWCIGCLAPRSISSSHAEFRPGQVWLDTAGQPINAHGGGMLFHKGTYYWYGENKEGPTWLPESTKAWDGFRVDITGIRFGSVRPEGQDSRDQTLFQDDDGKAYRIYSSENNDTTCISLLTDDYLKHSGRFARVFEKRPMEAQAVFKRGGKYWFIGSICTG